MSAQQAITARISQDGPTQGSLDGACPMAPQASHSWGASGWRHAQALPGEASLGYPGGWLMCKAA